jgi:hypothetical protein
MLNRPGSLPFSTVVSSDDHFLICLADETRHLVTGGKGSLRVSFNGKSSINPIHLEKSVLSFPSSESEILACRSDGRPAAGIMCL